MTDRSLQELLDSLESIPDYLYNDTPGPHSRTNPGLVPIPLEHTNWRDEQIAWGKTAVLFDQSHHMPELFLSGTDARELLSRVAVNRIDNLNPGIAKQFVAVTEEGNFIGDCVLYDLGDDSYELVSGKTVLNWVQFQAETSGLDVAVERDENTSDNATGRRTRFRYQLDGPNARDILAAAVDGEAPDVMFFHTARVRIAGTDVLVLGHGMAGHHGVELSGPFEQMDAVRDRLIDVGADFGLRRGGTRAYYSTAYESGWIGYPLPGIYVEESTRPFREWLPSDGWEAKYQLAGSFYRDDIREWYVNPYELGYRRLVNFDHDFIGRDALRAMSDQPLRERVTLEWNKEDVTKIFASLLDEDELPYRYLELPVADYGFPMRDEVQTLSSEYAGQSTLVGFSMNVRKFLSLAFVDAHLGKPGTELAVIWGEPGGGSRKPRVERHRQLAIRATVRPAPYAPETREMKGHD